MMSQVKENKKINNKKWISFAQLQNAGNAIQDAQISKFPHGNMPLNPFYHLL